MHSIRCTRIQQQQANDKEPALEVHLSDNQQPTSASPTKRKKSKMKTKNKETNNSSNNKTNKNSSPGLAEADDIDSILDEFKKLNNSCGYTVYNKQCKNSIKTLGQKCDFCGLIFCLTHHMAEVHGCGDAVRIKAKQDHAKYAMGGATSCSKPKPMKSAAKAHAQRKLDKKLDELQSDRKKKNKKK